MTTFKELTAAIILVFAGAVHAAAQRGNGALPPVPAARGPLRISIAYPAPGSAIAFGDSTFLFGTVGDGSASLTVAGQPVTVAPNGAWLAWVALPHDSVAVVPVVARHGRDSATAVLRLVRAGWTRQNGAWLDRNSFSPVGDVSMTAGEALPLAVRAAAGASVRLVLPDGRIVRFAADSTPEPATEAFNAFGQSERAPPRPVRGERYVATLRREGDTGRQVLRRGERLPSGPMLEVAIGRDTARVSWPMTITTRTDSPVMVTLNADPRHLGGNDPTTIGRAYPGGTYSWFFAPGTVTRMDMRIGDQVRLRLAADAIAWVPQSDVREMHIDDSGPAVMGSLTLSPSSDRTRLRIPLTRPVPARVDETADGVVISLFNAVSNADWVRYGAESRFVRLLTWKQETADRVSLTVTFDRALWGWRSWIDGTDLVYEFRQPPVIDPARPLAGRRIVVDAGHPPGGACGPTGLCEPEANLNIARIVQQQLIAAGAEVIMTRSMPGDVSLQARVALADSAGADLLVSIHNNALPDGINPFANSGTSTFFNHPHSLPLARAVQARLVANLGLPDLGVARGDLALVRPTWYPAILTEGLFMMVPEQEAALRTVEGQRRYATGVLEGVTAFLQQVARQGAVRQ